jgi:hypothetical protein
MISRVNVGNALCICILFILLGTYFLKVIELQKIFIGNGWITGDWLINYSGGFVRRGLLGEIFLKLGSVVNKQPQDLVVMLKFFLYAIFCVSFFLLVLKKGFGVVELILFLAPWSIIFNLNDVAGSGRKDILLISIFTFYTYLYSLKEYGETRIYKRWNFWFLMVALPFLTLTHEGLFFFYQYFFLLPLLSKKSNKKDFYAVAIPYLTSAFILIMLALFYKGDQIIADKICQSLVATGIDKSICGGAISSLGGFDYNIHIGYLKIYLPIAILTFVPLLCYGLSSIKMNSHSFQIRFFTLIIPTIPMYFLAADWGRWIHITGMLIFVSMIGMQDLRRIKFADMPPIVIFFICLTPYIYIFNWKIPHWIGEIRAAIILEQNFSGYISGFF